MGSKRSVVVIGSGAAGTAAARALARAGWHVVLAEHGKVGGVCLWRGCMPKKTLAHCADVRRTILSGEQFGARACDVGFDWQTVLAWKWHAEETYAGDQEAAFADLGIEVLRATARFLPRDQIRVGDTVLRPDNVVIATGSTPIVPPVPGAELTDTSDDALAYQEPPESLLIVGGGFIAFEFAGIYASFGTRVQMVTSADRLLEMIDPDIASVAVDRLRDLGAQFHTGCRLNRIARVPGGLEASFAETRTAFQHHGTYSRVLMAVGRRPALDDLGLDHAGVALDDTGRLVLSPALQTTNERVWAAGDAAGGPMQTPIASYQGRLVAASIDGGTPLAADYSVVPTTVFTIPQLGQVGRTEAQLAAAAIPYRVGLTRFDVIGAGIIADERDCLVKLLFSQDDGRLLGAHVAAPDAADIVYGLAVAMRSGATEADIRRTVAIHPSFSEAVNWAAW